MITVLLVDQLCPDPLSPNPVQLNEVGVSLSVMRATSGHGHLEGKAKQERLFLKGDQQPSRSKESK